MSRIQTHETLGHDDEVKMGSERSFGLVFGAVFLIVALWPLLSGGQVRLWALGIAAAFIAIAFAYPAMLQPLNAIWFKFGILLSKIMNPIILGILFFVVFLPIGWIVRRFVQPNLLQLKLEPDAESYWINRSPPGPEPSTMKNQF